MLYEKLVECLPKKACIHYTINELRNEKDMILMRSAIDGHLNIIEWIMSKQGFCDKDLRANNNFMLVAAVEKGHLDIIKWLVARPSFGTDCLTRHKYFVFYIKQNESMLINRVKIDVENRLYEIHVNREQSNCLLDTAAANGHIHIIQWVLTRLNLKKDILRQYMYDVMVFAANYGQLETLKWVQLFNEEHNLFITTYEEKLREHDSVIIRLAANRGHVEVLKWIMSLPTFTDDDLRVCNNSALRDAAANGWSHTVKYIMSRPTFGAEDLRANDHSALRWIVIYNYNNIMIWLYERWPTAFEVGTTYGLLEFYLVHQESVNLKVVKRIIDQFGL